MKTLEKNSIQIEELGLLMFLKLNTSPTEYVTEVIKRSLFSNTTYLDEFEEKGWIQYTKTGKKDPWYRVRLSDKGEEVLKSLNKKPEHELASECWQILEDAYKLYEIEKSKIINKSKTTFYISEFLYQKEDQGKSYTTKMFKAVVYDYLNSFDYEKKHFAKKTLNLLYDPSNKFASKWNIEDCPLWSWSEQNKDSIKNVYNKL